MDTITYIDLDAQREIIRSNLTQIANDVGMMMRDAGLHFPRLHNCSRQRRLAGDVRHAARSVGR
jgi:hypothetical protein